MVAQLPVLLKPTRFVILPKRNVLYVEMGLSIQLLKIAMIQLEMAAILHYVKYCQMLFVMLLLQTALFVEMGQFIQL